MDTTMTAGERYQAALAAVHAGNARGLSDRTMNKLWKAVFLAEDALKGYGKPFTGWTR